MKVLSVRRLRAPTRPTRSIARLAADPGVLARRTLLLSAISVPVMQVKVPLLDRSSWLAAVSRSNNIYSNHY